MIKKLLSSAWNLTKRSYQSVVREAHLSWQFIGGDFSTMTVSGLIFMVAAWNNDPSRMSFWSALGRDLLYFWLYAVSFCLANQIVGVDEDRLNKPHRPLVTGAVSYRGAIVRWAASMLLFSLVAWWFGVLEWASLWQVSIILYNFGVWAKHWATKNLIMGVGTVAQLAAAWQIVTPITPLVWRWILLIAFVVIPLVSIQDLRDLEGDIATGRNTFPIAFGETPSRIILCAGFILLPLAIHFALMIPAGNTWNVILWDIGLAIISWSVAARVVFYRSPHADHHTYMLFTYWYCAVLGSAIAIV